MHIITKLAAGIKQIRLLMKRITSVILLQWQIVTNHHMHTVYFTYVACLLLQKKIGHFEFQTDTLQKLKYYKLKCTILHGTWHFLAQ